MTRILLSTLLRPAAFLLAGIALALPGFAQSSATPAPADGMGTGSNKAWELVVSPYTHHWHYDAEHRRVGLVGLELHDLSDHSFWGGALFPNSFGQNSAYVYYGHEWNGIWNQPALYFKLSAGIIYGYRDQYADKVPYNHDGFSPGLIPAMGYRITPQDSVQAALLGSAGVMLMYDRRF